MRILGKIDRDYARSLLEYVGLGSKQKRRLFELSGGEQQRVAIAIALANKPPLLLADEPTGAVDTKTTVDLLELFKKISVELGTTVVIVTHDREISKKVERVVAIRDGKTSSEFVLKHNYADRLSGIGEIGGKAQVELSVLDRAGRLQIPRELLEKMKLEGNKIQVGMDENGRIVLSRP
jgi:energy-coupling factor transporter ATP-binding protein EcfA2